jgi:hypothetical protein
MWDNNSMEKRAPAKLSTKTATRYSRVTPAAAKPKAGKKPSIVAVRAKKSSLPSRIQVLKTVVPNGNPYDIGVEATLKALRQSGVLTAAGKLGKTFR